MDTAKQDDVAERLVARRARLQPFCRVDSVKHHLQLQRYYQLARQLYSQSEVYYAQSAYDNAYVFLAKFIKLCSNVIASHKDYKLPAYDKEREWVMTQAEKGGRFFDAILDGMEHEEREYLQYEREAERQAKKQSITNTVALANVSNLTLEERLEALRRRSAPASQGAALASSAKVEPARATVASTRQARSQPLPTRIEPSKVPRSKVSYPSIGKPSWISSVQNEHQSHSHIPKPVLSRQRSLDAFEQLSSGKIRKLEIPTNLIAQFTTLAAPNTNKYPYGIETCGILAGVLNGQHLVITTLIIPKQEGSSDMCSMTNEEELFDFCFGNDLLTLGWIHTHPKQTCFLSSVDMHTQCGFQSILPEAVAIVVAPTDRERNVGVFRLTEPNGLQLIQNCNLTGFHEHPSNVHVYSDAMECNWNRHVMTHLVDMR
uniref:MPN domain-containing protein n=1 Tax=Globisporangium ultimum (strain ATCC 200006 / CBS 805.95 / DAOM BR144) TaxID=431595 RepID=K3WK37_GLOUD